MNEFYSPEWLALSRHIGDKRVSPDQTLSLAFGALGGDVLYWQDATSGSLLLTRHEDWLNWVAGLAPAQHCQNYAPELQQMLADWTFSPLPALTAEPMPAFRLQKAEHIATQQGLLLTLHQNDTRLDILLLEADWLRLMTSTRNWTATQSAAVEGVPLVLSIGCTSLQAGEREALRPGCGVRLLQTPGLASGEVWLTLGEQTAVARLGSDRHLHLLSSFNDTVRQTHHRRDAGMDNIPLTLTAEIGQVRMTLGELRDLQPGDILQHLAHLDEQIRLTIHGVTVARGHLIQTDDGWLVRLSALVPSSGEEEA